MKKILVSTFLLSVFLIVAPVPANAQAGNFFQNFTNSIKQKMGRVMLSLPGKKSGKAVLEQSILASENITSARIDASLTSTVKDKSGQELMALNFRMEGPVLIKDIYDPDTAQQDLHISGELAMQGTSMTADADIKVDGKVVYFKLNQVPAIPFLPASQLKDQWMKVDGGAAEQAMIADETGELAESDQEKTELTSLQRQQLKELNIKMLKESQIGDAVRETVDGHKVFVVEVTIPDEVILSYMRESARIQGIEEAEIDDAVADTKKGLASAQDLSMKFYIDRSSFYTRKLEIPLTIDVSDEFKGGAQSAAAVTPFGDFSQVTDVEVLFTISMDEFNRSVEFSAPEGARDAAEVFAEVMGTSLGGGGGVGVGQPSLGATGNTGFGANSGFPPAAAQPGRPAELPEITPNEAAILRQYGIDPADLQ